jgi:signal transduction histidine kinase
MSNRLRIGRRIGLGFTLMLVLLELVAVIASLGIVHIVSTADDLLLGNNARTAINKLEAQHLEWQDQLYLFLTNQHAKELKIPLDPDKSAFGQWMQGPERREVEAQLPDLRPLLKEIEVPHRELHEYTKKILKTFRHADHELPKLLLEHAFNHLGILLLASDIADRRQPLSAIETDIALCPLEKWLHSPHGLRTYRNATPENKWHWDQLEQAHRHFHASIRQIGSQVIHGNVETATVSVFFQETLPQLHDMLVHLSALKTDAVREVETEEQADEILRNRTLPLHRRMQQLLQAMRTVVDKATVTDQDLFSTSKNVSALIMGIGGFTVFLAMLLTFRIKQSIVSPLNCIITQLTSGCDPVGEGQAAPTAVPAVPARSAGAIRSSLAVLDAARDAPVSQSTPSDVTGVDVGAPLLSNCPSGYEIHQNRLACLMSATIRLLTIHEVPTEIESLARAVHCYTKYQDEIAAAQHRFIANVAHQLKNPLTGMYMQIDMIAADIPGAHQQRIERLRDSLHKMGRLIQQLLTLARCSPESLSRQVMKVIDLDALIEENAAEWFDAALAKQIDLGFELSSARVLGLSWLLREMLANLIDNAVKYSRPGAKITVRCGRRNDASAFLEVEDNGPGIPLAERNYVFERFYRSEVLNDTRSEGTGLGLAIVKEVVECHSGIITLGVPDGAPGTKVVVEFPDLGIAQAQ